MNLKRRVIIFNVLFTLFWSILCVISLANERLLLFDDFSDGSLINPPHSVTNPIWMARYWNVPQPTDDGTGNMIISANKLSIQTDSANGTRWGDFEAEIKFRFIPENKDAFYSFQMNFQENKVTKATGIFLKTEWGFFYQGKSSTKTETSIRLGAEATELFTGNWQTFKLRVVGDKFTAYLDGVQIENSTVAVGFNEYNGINFHIESKSEGVLFDIDYCKITDITPITTAQPSTIAADGIKAATINVNWIPGGRLRISKPGISMFNLKDEPIDEVIVSSSGEAVFKVKGIIAGEYPLEESLDGVDWWESQSNQKAIKLIPVADPRKSSVYIPNLQEGQRFPAAGEDYPVTIKVNVVDYDEENIGDSTRHKVSIVKTNGGPGVISNPVILDGEGEATFTITSIESGTVILEAQIVPVDLAGNPIAEVETVKIENKLTITFDQAISPSNSKIEIVESEPVSADGVSKQQVKVLLKDYKNQAIGGRGVIITPQSTQGQVIISPDEEITSEEGIAFFEITATSSQKIAVPFFLKGQLTAEEGGQLQKVKSFEINFESPIIVGSGERESKILAERKLLASVEAYPGLINDAVPTDGASYWQIAVKLFAENGNPVVGRKVSLSAGEGELLDGDIKLEQLEPRTDSEGIVNYRIRTQQVLISTLTVNLLLEIENDRSIITHTLIFVPDEYNPVVLGTVPENGVDNAEVSAAVEIIFNEPIKATAKTKIFLEKDEEFFEEVYSGNESNWTFIDRKVMWQHARFQPNVQYSIEISGVSDLQGNIMDPYSWTFMAEDSQLPYILTDENGILLTNPRPGEPEVSPTVIVEIPFNEPLAVNESGKPDGLRVSLYKGEILVKEISGLSFEYIEQIGRTIVKFSLEGLMTDSTYSVVVNGAKDLAGLAMTETKWSFSTEDTKTAELLYYNPIGHINEQAFSRIIVIQFSDDVDITTGQVSLIHSGITYEVKTLSYNTEDFTWWVKPLEDEWFFDDQYEVVLDGIKKRINNPYGDAIIKNPLPRFTWSFTIVSGLPQVLNMDVLGGREKAELNASIEIIFDRFIKKELIPNIYIENKETQNLLDFSWEFTGEVGDLCTGLIINPTCELLFKYDSDYILWIEDVYGEGGQKADFSLGFCTKVENTDPVFIKADGTDKFISLEFGDNTEVVLDIPGNALLVDTELYAAAVRKSDIKVMINRLYKEQGIVKAYEIGTIPNGDFSVPITIKFPFVKNGSGLVTTIDRYNNEISVPSEQLFIAKWRGWETPDGKQAGEWIPLESTVISSSNLIMFETENTGVFAILGYSSIENVELLSEVRFTQNPLIPGQEGKRSETTLKFYLAEPSVVTLNIFDRNGRFIATVVDHISLGEGYHGLPWDGRINGMIISRGIYVIQLRVRNDSKNKMHHELLTIW